MDEEELFSQLGLLLGQMRFSRRALEDIERNTALYGGFAFTNALSAGANFGAPPLVNGALKVYITNIGDLAPGNGLGGFLGGLIGGIGRFFGGLFGGLVGGTISGVALPYMLHQAERISENVLSILQALGVDLSATAGGTAAAGDSDADREAAAQATAPGETLVSQLGRFTEIINAATALFQAAASGPGCEAEAGEAAARRSTVIQTEAGQRWLAVLESVRGLVAGINRIVDGLILLVPILIGSLALLIQRLDVLKLAVVEVLQFAVRNTFLLRGVILTTLFDLASSAARIAASLLGILAIAVEKILGAVFRMIGHVLDGAVAAFRFLATGLQHTIDGLLRWLIDTLGAALIFLGDLRIFRVLVHVIRIIPAVLPPLYELIRGSSPALTPTQETALTNAADLTIPEPTATGSASVPFPSFPNLAEAIAGPTAVAELGTALGDASRGLTGEVAGIFSTGSHSLLALGERMDQAAREESRFAGQRIEDLLSTVQQRSTELADALGAARDAAADRPATGLERIAQAYERWLEGNGLDNLLNNLDSHFAQRPPAQSPVTEEALATGVLRPRATVDIEDVTIVIEAPPAPPVVPEEERPPMTAAIAGRSHPTVDAWHRSLHRFRERGGQQLA